MYFFFFKYQQKKYGILKFQNIDIPFLINETHLYKVRLGTETLHKLVGVAQWTKRDISLNNHFFPKFSKNRVQKINELFLNTILLLDNASLLQTRSLVVGVVKKAKYERSVVEIVL